ncbi:MAG: hypothetical protein HFJ10_09405 [Lachnospiraceae bacterium]|jgi:L-fucose isomerase-like protein|nr:hypothetical protein [Lachnospiraceae bacterium]
MRRINDYKLGVCPIGKVLFSHKDTLHQKEEIYRKLDELSIPYVTIENEIPDGIIRTMDQVDLAVASLKEQGADALFIPHCNFGTEGAAGLIAKKLGLPTLLWAPRDETPLSDGVRLRDSLCGCFATSRVLQLMDVPFYYIENCKVDDDAFLTGIDKFVRASRVVKMVRTARIGQIGTRIPFFWCTINDEAELLNRFGVQVQTFDIAELMIKIDKRAEQNIFRYRDELSTMEYLNCSEIPQDGLIKSLAMRDELFDMAEEYQIDAYAVQFFDSLQEHIGPGAGLGLSLVEELIPCSAETDIYGALSSIIAEAVAGSDTPSFFPEYTIRHPENDNAVLMWHASAPLSLRHPEIDKVRILPPWILEGSPATSLQFYLKEGEITVCRFDGLNGDFALGIGEGRSIKGPLTREVYTWMEVDNWPLWERKLIEGPFIHHASCVYGRYADSLELASKFLKTHCIHLDQ